jgi:hypothetical protein
MDIKSYIASQLNEEQSAAALHINTSSLIIGWQILPCAKTMRAKIRCAV